MAAIAFVEKRLKMINTSAKKKKRAESSENPLFPWRDRSTARDKRVTSRVQPPPVTSLKNFDNRGGSHEMPPKPTSKVLFALDSLGRNAAEKKDPPVAETGKAPRLYPPPIFPSAPASGRLTRSGPFTGYNDRKPNPPYLVIKTLNVPRSPKPSRRPQAMRVVPGPPPHRPCIRTRTMRTLQPWCTQRMRKK
jgi:hypothetical protein